MTENDKKETMIYLETLKDRNFYKKLKRAINEGNVESITYEEGKTKIIVDYGCGSSSIFIVEN